ncbi:MAG: tRNA 2-thiocytidine(32) synthetase TtcA [Desulfuromonadales bacterium]
MSLTETRLYHSIKRNVGKAIGDFNLIDEGDRIAVGVSGGKDSYTLLHILEALRRRSPVNYELIAVNVDSGFPGYQRDVLQMHLEEYGFTHRMETTNAYQIIEEKRRPGSSYCAFCARLRRGALYSIADELGCNKIALGHHLDDFIETLLLNQFYSGTLAAMSPKLEADNGRHTVIRPLVYVEEPDVVNFTSEQDFPIICCACPVCGMIDQKRKRMKTLIAELARENPSIKRSMIGALGNVQPRRLMDGKLQRSP